MGIPISFPLMDFKRFFLSWGSTNKTKLKKLSCKQKQAVMNANDKMNISKLNVYHMFIYMFCTGQETTPTLFQTRLKIITDTYPTECQLGNYNK